MAYVRSENETAGPFCQSCGRAMMSSQEFGTDAESLRINAYCAECFRQGKFVEPKLALREMTDRVTTKLAAQRGISEHEARSIAEKWTPRLQRWTQMLVEEFGKSWGSVVAKGAVFILLGTILALQPTAVATGAIVYFIGGLAFVGGIGSFVEAFRSARAGYSWGPAVATGIVGVLVGLLTFFMPGITLVATYLLVATWAIVGGITQVMTAIRLRQVLENEFWMGLGGVVSIIFGVGLLLFPLAGVVTLTWLVTTYAIVYGAMQIMLGFQLRRLSKAVEPPSGPTLSTRRYA
jgi:uncharacterized membrane protein HdeD (DUF308 family)